MHHYIDIHLRADPEFAEHQLMAALFAKLHRVLAQAQINTIGVSFPHYGLSPATLGRVLRLIGGSAELTRLMAQPWLAGMRDHTALGNIVPVPENAVHKRLQRVQAKSSPERLMRRQMRRHELSEEEARGVYQDVPAQRLKLPYIPMASSSSGQAFKLFFRLGPAQAQPTPGDFNAYGLSKTATTPCF